MIRVFLSYRREGAVGRCDALLAVIGSRWAGSTDEQGRRRLDDANDFVQREIGAALLAGGGFRKGAPVRPAPVFHLDGDRLWPAWPACWTGCGGTSGSWTRGRTRPVR